MSNKKLKILLASPRGFCAGVERAIEIVKKSVAKYGPPVYVRHEIVHNKYVVDSLKNIGAIFVEELDEIEDKSRPVIFSAHGVPKIVPAEAINYKMEYIDATCPLVSKVHREAENLHKANYHILLIGHLNHPEVIGTMGQLPNGSIDLIHMSANSIDSDQYVDGSIDTAHIADNQVTLAKMAGLVRGKIIVGDAKKVIKTLDEIFDLVFLDAEKYEYLTYLKLVERKLHKGSRIVADNAGVFATEMKNYLDYVRESRTYRSRYYESTLEFRDDIKDGVEVSVRL